MKRIVFVMLAVLLSTTSAQMTWTCATESAGWAPRSGQTAVVFHDTMWLLGGGPDYATVRNDVWWSTDGQTWTCVSDSAQWRRRMCHASVVYDNKMWVIGGCYFVGGNYTPLQDVWYSTDGDSWVCATDSAQWPARWNHEVVVFGGKMWVIAGAPSLSSEFNDVWWSTDGVSWVCATDSAPWFSRQSTAAVVDHDTIRLMGGAATGHGILSDIWVSTDGASWKCLEDSANWSLRCGHRALVINDTLWLTGGNPDWPLEYRLNDVWYSTDGIWSCAADSAQWRPRAWHSFLHYGNRFWVMGGDSTQSALATSDVWYSTGLGVEETTNDERGTVNRGATLLSRLPAGAVVFDAMGRRAASPRPGVYFVCPKGERDQGTEGSSVRKFVITR